MFDARLRNAGWISLWPIHMTPLSQVNILYLEFPETPVYSSTMITSLKLQNYRVTQNYSTLHRYQVQLPVGSTQLYWDYWKAEVCVCVCRCEKTHQLTDIKWLMWGLSSFTTDVRGLPNSAELVNRVNLSYYNHRDLLLSSRSWA